MKKYIFALVLGIGAVLCNKTVSSQEYIEGNTYYDKKGKAYFYDENGKAFYYPEPVAIEEISDNAKSADNNNVEDNKSDDVPENVPASQTVDKNILADEELMKAITPEQLEEYVTQGADVNIKFIRKVKDEQDENKIIETKDVTPLMIAARYNENPKTIEMLLENGADIKAQNEKGGTALMFAAHNNKNPEIIEVLMQNGAEIEAKNKYGVTALMDAAYGNENPEVVETLLKYGANVEAKDNNGWTALMGAAYNNKNPEVIETLLKNGANIEAKNENGWTSLMEAAYNNKNPEVIEILLKNGANIEAKNKGGWTPLMEAARYNENIEVIETLLKHGANIEAKNNDGWTALRLADHNKNPKIVELLQKNIVEIIKMYDCSNGTYHKMCGIFENKTSSEQSPSLYIYYYDENDIKIGEERGKNVTIDPYGKAKFETFSFFDQFDHYVVKLKL